MPSSRPRYPALGRSDLGPTRRRRFDWLGLLVVLALAIAIGGTSVVWANVFGAGERFEHLVARVELALDPPPDRDTLPTVVSTPRPVATPTATGGEHGPPPTVAPAAPAPTPRPTPAPTPVPREPVDRSILDDPDAVFASQLTKDWCAPAGTQMTLAVLGLVDTSEATQRRIAGRVEEWESWRDSHNGSWGPAAIAQALEAYGAPGYEIRAYRTRADALLDAALALEATRAPVVLMTWRGAHTWVMTGYRADADPAIFGDARITGTYILDPWYPRVSSIWGPSDPPGTFQDADEMERNYLPWKRPEGRYPDRDGLFIAVVPTLPAG